MSLTEKYICLSLLNLISKKEIFRIFLKNSPTVIPSVILFVCSFAIYLKIKQESGTERPLNSTHRSEESEWVSFSDDKRWHESVSSSLYTSRSRFLSFRWFVDSHFVSPRHRPQKACTQARFHNHCHPRQAVWHLVDPQIEICTAVAQRTRKLLSWQKTLPDTSAFPMNKAWYPPDAIDLVRPRTVLAGSKMDLPNDQDRDEWPRD